MRMWKTLAASALAFTMASAAFAAANPFSDVSRTHWAYSAIQRAVDAGILQGFDGKFHGDKLVNRYQMAVIIKKILDAVAVRGGASSAGMSSTDIQNLEQLTIEFADELALLNVKVSTLEDSFTELRNQVNNIKIGRGPTTMGGGGGIGSAFTGFISVALASTDDNAVVAPAVAAGGSLTRFNPTPDQTFFTIPQASIALDHEVGDGIGLHVQYDYTTDGASQSVGGGVGLNEAYLFVDELFGDIGGKIGGFALPFQSWEYNGAFRTLDETITPSAKNTFFEINRVIGLEVTKTKDVDPTQIKWHVGIFNGNDTLAPGVAFPNIAAVAAAGGTIGAMNDAAGQGALTGSATVDDQFGFYLDIESGDDPDKNWGWRFGFFDNGGDSTAAPAVGAGPANSVEVDGFQLGFWWKNDKFKVQFEWLDGDGENNSVAGAIFNTQIDFHAWYLMVNFKMNDDTSLTLRYDDWENELNGAPATFTNVLEGNAITFAWNRRISDTSMFQFEYLTPDEDIGDAAPGAAFSDMDDDLVQFRYKVWF